MIAEKNFAYIKASCRYQTMIKTSSTYGKVRQPNHSKGMTEMLAVDANPRGKAEDFGRALRVKQHACTIFHKPTYCIISIK
jgi:hypothetical protein